MSLAVLDRALIEAARVVPSGWAYVTTRGTFQMPPHIRLLDEHLCALEAREIEMLIVEEPPRHGKSESGSGKFPGWYLGRNPDHRVMLTTYGATLSSDFGRKNRDDMDAWGGAVWGLHVDARSSAADAWNLEGRAGGMVTAGVGGSLTGRGADLLVIDDPVKNHEEAESQVYRDRTWNWYTSTAYTRLHPGGVILLIQTRWHEDDLAGRIQQNLPAGAVVLRLPALAEEDDPLGRAPGEALWPERYPVDALEEIRRTVGSYVWNSLYQQRPSAADGNLLKRAWWEQWNAPGMPSLPTFTPEDASKLLELLQIEEVIQSWDMSFKDTKGSDYVVGTVWGRRGADIFLLDLVRERMDFPTTRRALKKMRAKWKATGAILVEDKANGPAVIADLRHEMEGLVPVEPQGGKIARVVAVSHMVESGNVYLPTPQMAPWVVDFIGECAAFPNGSFDDQVDTMSQALLRLKRDHSPVSGRSPLEGSTPPVVARDKHGRRARRT